MEDKALLLTSGPTRSEVLFSKFMSFIAFGRFMMEEGDPGGVEC